MIIANHSHLLPYEGKDRDGLKKFMDECGIDQSVCFAPFELPDGLRDRYSTANHWLAHEIKADPDLFGFGTIDFSKDNIYEQVDEIVDLGFKGIKIHAAQQKIPLVGEKAFEVYCRAEEVGLFISFHTGVHFERIQPTHTLLYDEIADNFKTLKFSLEHVGGYSCFYDAMSVLINNRPWPDVHVLCWFNKYSQPENQGMVFGDRSYPGNLLATRRRPRNLWNRFSVAGRTNNTAYY